MSLKENQLSAKNPIKEFKNPINSILGSEVMQAIRSRFVGIQHGSPHCVSKTALQVSRSVLFLSAKGRRIIARVAAARAQDAGAFARNTASIHGYILLVSNNSG